MPFQSPSLPSLSLNHTRSFPMNTNDDDQVQFEFLPLIRTYKSGRVERLRGTDVVPPSFDPTTGVTSKDADIPPQAGVWARLYLPDLTTWPNRNNKLPILIYYHGGGFCIETAASPTYHRYLNSLSSRAHLLVVSVDYRRAPEHPLPAAYEDSSAALRWVQSQADAWLAEHGDLDRVFLAGDSAGANIAHHVALGAKADGVKIKGIALIHPYFWGTKPVGDETTDEGVRAAMEGFWRFACPTAENGTDDPRSNPMAEGLAGLGCERVMVCVAEKDLLRERGRAYHEGLRGVSGWGGEAELLESEGEDHVFHLFKPDCDKALEKMDRLVDFFNRD